MTPDGSAVGPRARRTLIILLLLGLAVLSFREQAVRAPDAHDLHGLARLFDCHAEFGQRTLVMAASSAALQKPADHASLIRQAADQLGRRPMSATPLLVLGAERQMAGKFHNSGLLYAEARRREPRNIAAHLLLADHHLRSRSVRAGLEELLAAARINPEMQAPTVAALAGYLIANGGDDRVTSLFRSQPALLDSTLNLLAQDLANLPLISKLATSNPSPQARKTWPPKIIQALVEHQRIAEAKSLWQTTNEVGTVGDVFNQRFLRRPEPQPFNWKLHFGKGGIAEFVDGGGLSIDFYGREDVTFARQLLTLSPGRYRLRTSGNVRGAEGSLSWNLVCADHPFSQQVPVDGNGQVEAELVVPNGCSGQWLELTATADERGDTFNGQIVKIDLARVGQ